MEIYFEQSVLCENTSKMRIKYTVICALAVVMVILAVLTGANVLGSDPGAIQINWLNLAATVLFLAAAFLLYRNKDRVRVEYDYTYHGDALEVCCVYNASKRRRMAMIPLKSVSSCGRAAGAEYESILARQQEKHNWIVHQDAPLFFMCYLQDNARHIAHLEFNDEMIRVLKSSNQIRNDAWIKAEGEV